MEETVFVPISLFAQKARLRLEGEAELLSAGMEGVVSVAFRFSPDWDGLQKTAVFSNGTVTVNVPEAQWDDNLCAVPAEVLRSAVRSSVSSPAICLPVFQSYTSPSALRTTTAPTFSSPTRRAKLPIPVFMQVSMPAIFPTVVPQPAPRLPSR